MRVRNVLITALGVVGAALVVVGAILVGRSDGEGAGFATLLVPIGVFLAAFSFSLLLIIRSRRP